GISLCIEHRTGAACRIKPLRKELGWQRVDVEVHVGEAGAAEIGREATIRPRMVGLHVEPRHRPGHGVNLAGELRHKETVHDARRSQLEAYRRADRYRQLIDACDAELGVDEQPLPVERDDLNLEGLRGGDNRLSWIKIVRTDPGDPADENYSHQRDRPDEHLEATGICEIRLIARPYIRCTKPEGNAKRRNH